MCTSCGALNQPVCNTGSACAQASTAPSSSGTTCVCEKGTVDVSGTCAPCGTFDQLACAGNTCTQPETTAVSGVCVCQPWSVQSGTECLGCGGNEEVPCTTGPNLGCSPGFEEANDGSVQVCVSACGSLGQLPCTNGPTGTQNGESQGGCVQWDTVILPGSNVCQWPTTCGRYGQVCCDAGNIGQGPNSTTDLCHDGSTCAYVGANGLNGYPGSWTCGGSSNIGGGGCVVQDFFYYEICGDDCESLPTVSACSQPANPTGGSGCVVYEGFCPDIKHP